jgi:hypothetical protein
MATPLYDVPEAEDTLGRMPHFDQWGPCLPGTERDNPYPFCMIGEEALKLECEGIDHLQASTNPHARRNARVFLSVSSSKEGHGVNPAAVQIPNSPTRTQPTPSAGRLPIGIYRWAFGPGW